MKVSIYHPQDIALILYTLLKLCLLSFSKFIVRKMHVCVVLFQFEAYNLEKLGKNAKEAAKLLEGL